MPDRPALSEEGFAEKLHNAFCQTDLLIERGQDLLSREWIEFAKNYMDGKLAICGRCRVPGVGEDRLFRFILTNDAVRPVGAEDHFANVPIVEGHSFASGGNPNINEMLPMLMIVGYLVDSPEGLIPSRMWLLCEQEAPHVGRKFLFNVPVSDIWVWLALPCRFVQTSPRKSDTGGAALVFDGKRYGHLVECITEFGADFSDLEAQLSRRFGGVPGDYVKKPLCWLDSHGAFGVLDEAVDDGCQFSDFALSTFDLFE